MRTGKRRKTSAGSQSPHETERSTEHMILNRLTSQNDQEEWLRIRKSYLTGTDAGAVCGMNP